MRDAFTNTAFSILKLFLIVSIASGQSAVVIPIPGEKPDPAILSLAVMNVDILIDNQHATVRIMQIYDNHTPRVLEGKYVFGLPQRSSIADFAVWDGNLRIPGVMMEKRRANEIYTSIKQKQADPGILQTTDGPGDNERSASSGFSARIFPINAFGTKRLEMEYTEELPVDNLTSHFTFPLKPSYGEVQSVREFNLSVRVLNDFPISPIDSDQAPYPLQITKNEPNEFDGEFHATNVELRDDFAFNYQIIAEKSTFSVIAHREPERISAYDLRDPSLAKTTADGFFQAQALFVGDPNTQRPPRRVVLALDTSLSMYGDKLTRAVEALDFFLHSLTPDDQFNLLLFNEDATTYAPNPVSATADAVEQAMQFVKTSNLEGGTSLKKALERSVEQTRAFGGSQSQIVLISDANPTLGTTKTDAISAALEKSNARFFAFGLGVDSNTLLLADLTKKSHGAFDQARETEDISLKLRNFFDKVGNANISGLTLDSPDGKNLYDIFATNDDSFFGSVNSFVGRYRKPKTQSINLSGVYGGNKAVLYGNVSLPELETAHAFLPRVWAKAKVDALLEVMNRDGEREDYIAEIIRLAEEYKLVTPYTAFLAAPRALLRPRLIQPGDPVIRVKTDPSVTEIFAVLPFGETMPMKFLEGEGVWETRFLAPPWMADGTYTCRLVLTDRNGNGYQEEKSFVIDSRAPRVRISLDKQSFNAGDNIPLRVLSDSDTYKLTARIYGAKPVSLRWSARDKANVGSLRIPDALASGHYTLTVSAEDFAHNQTTEEMTIEVLGK